MLKKSMINGSASKVNFQELIQGMRNAFSRGENVMEYAWKVTGADINMVLATLVTYDLQAGTYIKGMLSNPKDKDACCVQLAEKLTPLINDKTSLIDVSCGEATTIAGILGHLKNKPICFSDYDISWFCCYMGNGWLSQKRRSATLFIAGIFNIPVNDNYVNAVSTSYSIGLNGGPEQGATLELWRYARKAVVLEHAEKYLTSRIIKC